MTVCWAVWIPLACPPLPSLGDVADCLGAVGEVAGVGDDGLPALAREAEQAHVGADLAGGLLDAADVRDGLVQLLALVGVQPAAGDDAAAIDVGGRRVGQVAQLVNPV